MVVTTNHLNRSLTLTIHYYRLLTWYNIAFTLLTQIALSYGGIPLNRLSFFVSKLAGFTIAVLLHSYVSKNHYFYFRNAGYIIRWLVLRALILDICIYIPIAVICLN
jgi:hypothetical protein